MTTAAISAAIFVIAAVIIFTVARRVMRFAVRLALIGALGLALLIGALVWWYKSGGAASLFSGQNERPPATERNRSR